jgi:hypothetical protein
MQGFQHYFAGILAGGDMAKKEALDWHTAFAQAIQLEFDDYKDVLEFRTEYQLTTEPLRIDVVIVKKNKDVVINKTIARIFRDDNIIEFKSPLDNFAVSDFIKVYAYACLYANLNKKDLRDISVTLAAVRKPVKLIRYLRESYGYAVEEFAKGVYHVTGDILRIQILETKLLSETENLWLKNLRNGLNTSSMAKILDNTVTRHELERVHAYMCVISEANPHALEEFYNMQKSKTTLDEVLVRTGIAAKAEARKAEEFAQNLRNLGVSVEIISQAIGLTPDEIAAL